MSARWNGNSGRLRPFTSNRENIRNSPKVKGEKNTEACAKKGEYDPNSSTGRPAGEPRIFSPEQAYNYKSKYSRYQKSLLLRPSNILQEGNIIKYQYYSCHAPNAYWTVTVGANNRATYFDVGKSLTIICPVPYKLDQIKTDGKVITWAQIAGDRSILLDPPTDPHPTLYIENTCFTDGCTTNSPLPIIIRGYPEGQPDLFEDLIIYNTPTSTNYGNSFAGSGNFGKECRKIKAAIPAPQYTYKAYCNYGQDITVTWDLPCDTDYLLKTIWQKNTTGSYTDIDTFLPKDERFQSLHVNEHYRVVSYFSFHGVTEQAISKPIYFSYQPDDTRQLVFADDTYNGLSFTISKTTYNKIPLGVIRYSTQDVYSSGISFISTKQLYNKIPLGVTRYSATDSYSSGISFTAAKSSYKKYNLGGIVIG